MLKSKLILTFTALLVAQNTFAANTTIESFDTAKKELLHNVYTDYQRTLYCKAKFDSQKNVVQPKGFYTTKYKNREHRIEWEHSVPAENFGRAFKSWRDGDPSCVTSSGKTYKNRRCATKVDLEYRLMQADMHNLFPAIGSVNALRSNYNFRPLPDAQPTFGSCEMKIENRKADPPEASRGRIARAYKYMQKEYPRYKMSKQQNQLMDAWDKMYPVSDWECTRNERIKAIQGNSNSFVEQGC